MDILRKNRYVDVYLPGHHRARRGSGNVHEHIVVAEEVLGRKLIPSEVVHHQDEIKYNNSPDNLYVFKDSANHTRYHNTGIKVQEGDYWISPDPLGKTYICAICDEGFIVADTRRKYCSERCSQLADRVVARPTSDELYNLLLAHSFSEVGRIYGVTCNAVRKWCKQYDIPHHSTHYKEVNSSAK